MSEPNGSFNFTAQMLASEPCGVGNGLVYDSNLGVWRVSTAANRATANARTQAIAKTAYGGSMVGKVQYQMSGVLAAEISGLGAGAASWVRMSTAGICERFTPAGGGLSDIIGKCFADGRVALDMGVWTEDMAVGGGGGTTPTLTAGLDISVGAAPNYTVAFTGAIPTLTAGTGITVGTAPNYTVTATGGGFTAGGDLTGTSSSQQVVALTGAAGALPLATTAATLQWATGTASPTIKQADNTTNGATAQTMSFQAQNATGTTSTGGNIQFNTGTGTTNQGGFIVGIGGVTKFTILPSGSVRLASLGAGVVHSDGSGNLTSSAVVLTSDVTGVLPFANMQAPAGTGYAKVSGGAWTTTQAVPIPIADGGTNNTSAPTTNIIVQFDGTRYTSAPNLTSDNTGLVVASTGYIKTGAGSQALSGTWRQGNTSSTLATFRDAANGSDLPFLANDNGSNGIFFGTNVAGSAGALHTSISATADVSIQTTASFGLKVTTTDIQYSLPRHGNSSPFSSDGEVTIIGAGVTLLAAQYSRTQHKYTTTANGTFVYPVPADQDHSYTKVIECVSTSSATPITLSIGSGTTFSFGTSGVRGGVFKFTPTGVFKQATE